MVSDASSSDDNFSESLQFVDHYYRLQKEIELSNEQKETKIKPEINALSNTSYEVLDDNEKFKETFKTVWGFK